MGKKKGIFPEQSCIGDEWVGLHPTINTLQMHSWFLQPVKELQQNKLTKQSRTNHSLVSLKQLRNRKIKHSQQGKTYVKEKQKKNHLKKNIQMCKMSCKVH